MTWPFLFTGLALLTAPFGFGFLADALVAQVLSVGFLLIGLGTFAVRISDGR